MTDARPAVLDEIDRQLIAALQINARESVAMLARQLGIARTTVTSRLARLERSKVISGYGVRLGQRVIDGGLQAYVGITVQPRSGKDVVRKLSAMGQIQQLCAVSGEFDYVAWLRSDSPEQLDQLLDQIGSVEGVEKTTTSIILSSKVDRGQPLWNTRKHYMPLLLQHRLSTETLRTHKVQLSALEHIDAAKLVDIRERLNMSRPVFAMYLRTNTRTLENWEQGRARPNAQAVALIRLVQKYPETVERLASLAWARAIP